MLHGTQQQFIRAHPRISIWQVQRQEEQQSKPRNANVQNMQTCPQHTTSSHWPFPLWVPLFGIVSHLKSALFHGICPARFTSSLKLLFSPGPGLGASLSSYLEVALYKFHRHTIYTFVIFISRYAVTPRRPTVTKKP